MSEALASFPFPEIDFRERNRAEFGFPYKFSIVMAIYNAALYLEEAIESIIFQSIGFQENIQLILVDNASNDGSGEICKEYLEKYPDNVTYVQLEENQGPGGARNVGIPYIKGKFVNFMDADDKWGERAFHNVNKFFDKNPQLSIAVCRVKYFDAENTFHILDFRFKNKKRKIISIFENYEAIQVHTNNVFFRENIIPKYSYRSRILHGEDIRFFTEVILQEERYGLLEKAWYYYRKQRRTKSLLRQEQMKETYFSEVYSSLLFDLTRASQNTFQEVVPYVQSLLLYTIFNRIRDSKNILLSDSTQKYFLDTTARYIQLVDDDIIGGNGLLRREEKVLLLELKYGKKIFDSIKLRNGNFKFNYVSLFSAKSINTLKITNMDYLNGQIGEPDSIEIFGKVCIPIDKKSYRVVATKDEDTIYDITYFQLDISSQRQFCGYTYYEERGFKVRIPLEEPGRISFNLIFDHQHIKLKINFQFVSKLTNHLRSTYYIVGDWILSESRQKTNIIIEKRTKKLERKHEKNVLKELIYTKRIRTFCWRILILIGRFIHRNSKQKIWLFIDYFSQANDNAESIFKFVLSQKNEFIKPYFVISKSSADYERIKEYAKVIPYDTKYYRFLFSICDMIITSQTFFSRRNTFFDRTDVLKDLFHFKYVYLQHGIIKDNHANTLAHYKTDLDILITSAQAEYDSLMSEEYQLTPRIVKLTGLARYDELVSVKKNVASKKILLAPTWRRTQIGEWDENIQGYKYQETFKNSGFFQFFNGLITDTRILHSLEKNGYEIEIQLHPRLWEQRSDFSESEYVKIEYVKKPLIEKITEIAMLVTDYSSVAFDYAYVKIPIIYMQFDKDAFYADHAYTRGYFDFDRDGFGPVCYDYESAVQTLLGAIENHCALERTYEDRIDRFFMYRDGKNCERIYKELLKLDGEM